MKFLLVLILAAAAGALVPAASADFDVCVAGHVCADGVSYGDCSSAGGNNVHAWVPTGNTGTDVAVGTFCQNSGQGDYSRVYAYAETGNAYAVVDWRGLAGFYPPDSYCTLYVRAPAAGGGTIGCPPIARPPGVGEILP